MSEAEWGQMARWQDELAHTEDLRQKQRQNVHKLLYKNDLQKMMDQKKHKSRTISQRDKQFYKDIYQGNYGQEEMSPEQQRFLAVLKQSAKYNLDVGQQRKQRVKSQVFDEKSKLKEKFKKVETEMSEEKDREVREREDRKRRLAMCYQQQMGSVESLRSLQKMEDHRFQEVARELQLKKERERANYMHKIKYGYAQNPESYEVIKQKYQQKQQLKGSFLNKMENSRLDDNSTERKRQQKHQETIETSKFNKNYFVDKQMRRRQMQMKEVEEEHEKIERIQRELAAEEERRRLKKCDQRKMLQHELDHQISESGENKVKWKKMSQNQSRINKELFSHQAQVLLPGIARDYKDKKREYIMQNFLKNPGSAPSALQSLQPKGSQY